jgi:hypothetical protein
MDTTITAHYSNQFDTYAGRQGDAGSEVLAQFVDEYIARDALAGIVAGVVPATDIPDFVSFSITVDGVEVERTGVHKTGAYNRNAQEYARTWQED